MSDWRQDRIEANRRQSVEAECRECGGRGGWYNAGDGVDVECPACWGRGFIWWDRFRYEQTEVIEPLRAEVARLTAERDEQAKAWHKVNRQLMAERDEARAAIHDFWVYIEGAPIEEFRHEAWRITREARLAATVESEPET